MITPFLEQYNVYQSLNLEAPLYGHTGIYLGPGFGIHEDNAEPVSALVHVFLCPSDQQQRIQQEFGPSNYTACWGSNVPPWQVHSVSRTDGVFYANSRTRFSDMADGTSHTALFSESTLSRSEGAEVLTADNMAEVSVIFRSRELDVLTVEACTTAGTPVDNSRNARWVDGWPRYSGYDHRLTPNSAVPDCVRVAPMREAWKAARSRHPGGVHLLLADGSVRFVSDTINLSTWQALGSARSGQVIGGNAALGRGITTSEQIKSVILSAADWPGKTDTIERLAAHQATMVLFTMRAEFEDFIDKLSTHYPPETPVAIVKFAGYREQESVIQGVLGTIVEELGDERLPFEYMIYVGQFLSHRYRD